MLASTQETLLIKKVNSISPQWIEKKSVPRLRNLLSASWIWCLCRYSCRRCCSGYSWEASCAPWSAGSWAACASGFCLDQNPADSTCSTLFFLPSCLLAAHKPNFQNKNCYAPSSSSSSSAPPPSGLLQRFESKISAVTRNPNKASSTSQVSEHPPPGVSVCRVFNRQKWGNII